jgi:hypothetical protein
MCRPAGAHFEDDGIGYKYAAPLGLSEFAALNNANNGLKFIRFF